LETQLDAVVAAGGHCEVEAFQIFGRPASLPPPTGIAIKHTTHPHRPDRSFSTGFSLLNDPALNKGTAFTLAERDTYRLQGLLPPHVHTIEEQKARVTDQSGPSFATAQCCRSRCVG